MSKFKEFGKSVVQTQECFNYAKEHKLGVFQRDLNAGGAKILLADTYENIFNKIRTNENSNIYEYWSSSQNIKLFIDYDKKVIDDDKKCRKIIDEKNNHKTDVLNIINYVKSVIPNITSTCILKSIPNTLKKSYHIIFNGIHFSNRTILKKFIEEQLKPKFKDLFDKKIIDMKVYGNLCFRTLLSTKYGQNRPLYLLNTDMFLNELQEVPIMRESTTFDDFLKCSISYINESSQFYNYKSEKKNNNNNNKKMHMMNDEDIYSDKDVVRKFLDLLDPDRYNDYNKWLNVGFILYSINVDYIDLWHYFSNKWDNYDEDICNAKWNTFNNSEYIYTINNLIFLARIDNPEDCKLLLSEIPEHDIKYLRSFDNVLSKLVHRLYGEKFVCSDPKKDEWYYFNGIRWKKENKSLNLRKKIINDVFNKIENYRKQLIKDGASDEIIKNYHGILNKLGSGLKLNCLELEFYNENFYKIIDQHKDLIGFENGIYDLKDMSFRGGVPSDYISMSTGYDYKHYASDDPLYKDVMNLLIQILPDYQTREFTLKSLSSCLDGHTRDENFYIWSGKNNSGGNGKSTITELLAKALGEYAIESPVTLVTKQRESANSPNSALSAIRNKRVVIMQEPGANDLIQNDIIKMFTGGDKISTRELNSTQIEFKPNAKFFMAANTVPSITTVDGGTIRRLKITEFISKFVDDPKESDEYKIDKELKSKLDVYKPVFLCILLDYYVKYRRDGLIPPDAVMKVTKKYEINNNNMKGFIDEYIVKSTKTDFITLDEIKLLYRNDSFIKVQFPKVSIFVNQLEMALGNEFKQDPRKKIKKMDGFCLRVNVIDDDLDVDENKEI
jgi:P4 family phage/plasmid primase-like protien